jgi:hypothetical protein
VRPLLLFLLTTVFAPGFGAAKSGASDGRDFLDKSVAAAGGSSRYRRLETLRYDFLETRYTEAGPATFSGKHYLRLHDAGGLRVREEAGFPGGKTVTVVNSSGVWHWHNGAAVADPDRLGRLRRELLEKAFWVLAPFRIQEEGCSVSYGGLEYFQDKLTRRLDVAPCGGLAFAGGFSLFVDSDSDALAGAAVPGPEGPLTVVLSGHRSTNLVRLALRREVLSDGGKKIYSLTVLDPALNLFVDENLFQPSARAEE